MAYAALLGACVISGCASFTPVDVVGKPSEVTVEQALKSVGDGLRDMRLAIGENKTGLVPAEVIVNFKLAASATTSGKLTVDLSIPLTSGGAAGSGKIGAEANKSAEGSRSNDITIKFVNLLLVPKDTLATVKSADEIGDLITVMEKKGITTFFVPQSPPKQYRSRFATAPRPKNVDEVTLAWIGARSSALWVARSFSRRRRLSPGRRRRAPFAASASYQEACRQLTRRSSKGGFHRHYVSSAGYANNQAELLPAFAEEFVRLKVEIIVANGTDAAIAAKNVTTSVPIVMINAGDPIRTSLVSSLARPGGNITGFSNAAPEVDAKLLSLLRELLPTAQRVGVLVNPNNPIHAVRHKENEQVYRSLAIQPIFVEVNTADGLESAVAQVSQRRGDALIVLSDHLFLANAGSIMRAALHHALPTMVEGPDMLEAGGLISYAVNVTEQRRRVAALVDKILRGAKPADLPIEQPTKFDLGINLKTAKALGLTIPQSLLLRADEVIQ